MASEILSVIASVEADTEGIDRERVRWHLALVQLITETALHGIVKGMRKYPDEPQGQLELTDADLDTFAHFVVHGFVDGVDNAVYWGLVARLGGPAILDRIRERLIGGQNAND